MGQNPPDVKLTDDQLSNVADNFEDTDNKPLQDSVTPTPNRPKSKGATGRLLTAAQKPQKQTLSKAPTRRLSASSSSSLPSVDNPLSTPASGPVSSQQSDNSSNRALMPVTSHSSPRSSQQKRAAGDTDSEQQVAKETKRRQKSRGIDQFEDPRIRKLAEQASITIRRKTLFDNSFLEDVD